MRLPFLVAAVDRALLAAGRPARGETLVVALSGGADSVALTAALAALRRRRGFELVAAHLDHALRPGSAEDAAFCHELCASLAVPLHAGTARVRARAGDEKGGLEQAARRERYSFLRRVKDDEGAVAIAVAHTQDDQAETLLLRLLRGSGPSGLASMRLASGDLLRPLLAVSRREVVAYLRERRLAWREDETNADPAYARNRVRHELLPYLEQRFNPRVREALARTADLIAEEASYMSGVAERALAKAATREGDALVLDRRALAGLPVAVARATLRLALLETGGLANVDGGHVERLLRLARSPAPSGRRLPLPGGREARFTHLRLRLEGRANRATKAVSSSRHGA
jgi:tRNA(Ile)-lysidine synthase